MIKGGSYNWKSMNPEKPENGIHEDAIAGGVAVAPMSGAFPMMADILGVLAIEEFKAKFGRLPEHVENVVRKGTPMLSGGSLSTGEAMAKDVKNGFDPKSA